MIGRAPIKKRRGIFRLTPLLAEFENEAFIVYPRELEMILSSLLLQRHHLLIFEAFGELRFFPLPIKVMIKKLYKYCERENCIKIFSGGGT